MDAQEPPRRGSRAWFKRVLRDRTLSVEARFLVLLIDSHGDLNGSNCWPSMIRLREYTGRNIKWVQKYIEELHKKGWLTWVHRSIPGGRVNQYTVHIPEKWVDLPAPPAPRKERGSTRKRDIPHLPEKRVDGSTQKTGIDQKPGTNGAEHPFPADTSHNAAASNETHPADDDISPFRDQAAC